MSADIAIRSSPRPRCYLCDHPGQLLYEGIHDCLFGAPGNWTLARCANRDCGLIWLDPMPIEEDIAMAYRQYYTHGDTARRHSSLPLRLFGAAKQGYLALRYGYRRDSISFQKKLAGWLIYLHPGRRAVVDFNVMWLAPVANGRLLDVGCGGGEFLRFMCQLGWQGEGVDFDAEAARNAAGKGLKVHVGPIEAQAFPSGAFDAVTASHVVEHVHRPRQLIEECHRILKPGGRLVVVTPNSDSLGHRLYREHWRGLEPPRHLHLFNARNLQRMTQSAGFGAVATFTSIRDAYGIFVGSHSIRRGCSYAAGQEYPAGLRIFARSMEFVEWLVLQFAGNAGEEIVLIAEK